MRRVVSVAAVVLAAALSCCGVGTAFAWEATNDDHLLFFSGVDFWRNGQFAHGGMLWSPGGLASEGFTLKLLLASGTYNYHAGLTKVTGLQHLAAVMPGWRIKQDSLEIVVAAGPEVQQHDLGHDDIGNRLRGTHFGVRFGGDLWFQPTNELMVASAVSIASITWQYWTRAQFGVRIPGLAWIGPEYHALGDGSYLQQRWGIHLTGFRTSELEWSVGAGYLYDSDDRVGPYGRIGINIRR
jgi:hypothetical protein